MTTEIEQNYLKRLVRRSVKGTPSEYDTYGLITEALILHKKPMDRFVIFPQLSIPWNPSKIKDKRSNLPDFGIGNFYDDPPYIRLQGGIEVKGPTELITRLPSPDVVSKDKEVMSILHAATFQAEDQAKAAIKNEKMPNKPLLWLMFIGPYFTIIQLGGFSEGELSTRSHKPNDSGDFVESIKILIRKDSDPVVHDLYLLGTPEAAAKLEYYINFRPE
jgi:hypothetical protein